MEGLASLLDCLGGHGQVCIFHNENGPTFHPKMYVFSNDRNAEVIIGSGNLTRGGLLDNYEASIALTLDLTDADDRALFTGLEAILDAYTDLAPRTTVELTHETLERLRADRYILLEAEMRHPARRGGGRGSGIRSATGRSTVSARASSRAACRSGDRRRRPGAGSR